MSEKKILVTGGAGFIGSHLCRRLLADGCVVICADNFYTGHQDNVKELLCHSRFELIQHDITEPLFLHVDEIYNLACPASPVHYQADPIKTLTTNVMGTMNMLDLAQRSQAKFLQASTSEVYGDPLIHPQAENYWGNVNPIGIRSCYDEGKRCAETLCFDYYRKFNLDVKVVRIFNTYGPRMHPQDGRVVSNFIMQALQGKDITIYGNGQQTRSFCYVDDLVGGLVRCMATEPGFIGPMNLGNPCEFTIRELADKLLQLCKSKSNIVYAPLPEDDPKQRKPDISLARNKIGWEPKVALEVGLQKTISYFK